MFSKRFGLLILIIGLILLVGFGLMTVKQNRTKSDFASSKAEDREPTVTIDKKVKYPEDYTLVLMGDSMTEALGNSDELRSNLVELYPDKTFEFLNYGFGSTNILSVEKRLTENTQYGRDFRPVLNIDFDLILIESFGYNPLSQYPLNEGLEKQTQALDKIVSLIKSSNPRAPVIFVATIAPNSKKYGQGEVDLTPEKRSEWVAERNEYIKNHIAYGQNHNIPVINIYQKSLIDGDGNLDLIDGKNHIHPSPTGVRFISREIADFLKQNKILENIKKQ